MKKLGILFICLLLLPVFALAQTPPPTDSAAPKILVGTIERPPMMMKDKEGRVSGFAIDLWEEIARRTNQSYEYKEFDLFGGMVTTTEAGGVDLSLANITITSAREEIMEYSQPIYDSGLQILLPARKQKASALSFFRVIWMSGILWLLAGAFVLLLIIAHILWYFERNVTEARHDYFRDDYFGGVFDAFWWAFIIMTMGGFENEVPHKKLSRFLAMFWILVSLFFVSTLTAKITTALTVNELSTGVSSVKDLSGKRVGTMTSPVVTAYLDKFGVSATQYKQYDELYAALIAGEIDAAVGDEPIIRYYALNSGRGRVVLAGHLFKPEKYGILYPKGSPRKEEFDQVLIAIQEDGTFAKLYDKYFAE